MAPGLQEKMNNYTFYDCWFLFYNPTFFVKLRPDPELTELKQYSFMQKKAQIRFF